MPTSVQLVQHLHWRAGMGLRPDEVRAATGRSYEELVAKIFSDANAFEPLRVDHTTATRERYAALNPKQQMDFRKASRTSTYRLNALWRRRLAQGGLREKMALFWHGHFASWSHWSISAEQNVNVLREHALGDFGTLLKAVSRSASMLEFLNNQRNKKDAPNENFAREVMELFTLGRGAYTEQDIKEAARAFTGWSFDMESAAFHLRENQHDFGEKTFRGKTGAFGGDDILDIILADKRCAQFIAGKVYRWFVDPRPDEAFIAAMGDRFFESGYDIADLMQWVFMSEHFKSPARAGQRIKSPIELLCGMDRLVNIAFETDEKAVQLQRILGQLLFYPPSVAGWSEGRAWIDSNSLMLRLKLPAVLLNKGVMDWQPEEGSAQDNDINMGMTGGDAPMRDERGQVFRFAADFDGLLKELGTAEDKDLLSMLLVIPPSEALRSTMSKSDIAERTLEVLCSPEYQLC